MLVAVAVATIIIIIIIIHGDLLDGILGHLVNVMPKATSPPPVLAWYLMLSPSKFFGAAGIL